MSRREAIAAAVTAADPAFVPVVRAVGPPPARRSAPVHARFADVTSSITSQLLATSAADTIHARVVDLCGGLVTPASIARAGIDDLKAVGLNRAKATAMVSLAMAVMEGAIDFSAHGRASNQSIIDELTAVKGIGPWTVQMYLMHTLARPDVWPVGDYGVRNGWSLVHGLTDTISERALREEGRHFVGIESAVAWYCWQAVHLARTSK